MAHKKGQSSSRNGRDSNPKFLGIKAFGGESVSAGSEMSLPEAVAAAVFSRKRGDSARFFVNRLEFPERRVILIIRR